MNLAEKHINLSEWRQRSLNERRLYSNKIMSKNGWIKISEFKESWDFWDIIEAACLFKITKLKDWAINTCNFIQKWCWCFHIPLRIFIGSQPECIWGLWLNNPILQIKAWTLGKNCSDTLSMLRLLRLMKIWSLKNIWINWKIEKYHHIFTAHIKLPIKISNRTTKAQQYQNLWKKCRLMNGEDGRSLDLIKENEDSAKW